MEYIRTRTYILCFNNNIIYYFYVIIIMINYKCKTVLYGKLYIILLLCICLCNIRLIILWIAFIYFYNTFSTCPSPLQKKTV